MGSFLALALPAAAAETIEAESVESFFDRAIPTALDEFGIPGATVSVVHDGKPVFVDAYGMADLERGLPFDAGSTLVRIASITKTFTWTAIMQLAERGLVDLDTDVNSYLDSVQVPAAWGAPVTLRHLMTHTAGFEDRTIELAARTPDDLIPLNEYLARTMPQRILPPGVMTAYSNFGAGLAGQIVADVTGMPYEDYISAHILEPLDMSHTVAVEPVPTLSEVDMARSYSTVDGELVVHPTDLDLLPPDGVISSTAEDMSHYMLAHLEGGTYQGASILETDSLERMHEDAFVPSPGVDGWTLGFKVRTLEGHRAVMHDGSWEEFLSAMVLVPDADLGVFVAFNGDRGLEALPVVLEEFFARFLESQQRPTPSPTETVDANHVEIDGFYRPTRSSESTVSKLLTLVGSTRATLADDGSLHFSGRDWYPIATGVYEDLSTSDRLAVVAGDDTEVFLATDWAAYQRLPLSDTLPFNLVVLAVFGLVAIATTMATVVGWAIQRARSRRLDTPSGRRWAVAAAVCGLVFVALLAATLFSDTSEFLYGVPLGFQIVMLLPFAFLALAVITAARMASGWSDGVRVRTIAADVLILAGFVALTWFLFNWNLVGFHF